jgi:hypothetical protein
MEHLALKHQIFSIRELESHYYKMTPNGHWFDKDTMAFFKSRLNEKLYYTDKVIYFISSEKGPSGLRRYSIRYYVPLTGEVGTHGEFQKYKTLAAAKLAASKIKGVQT